MPRLDESLPHLPGVYYIRNAVSARLYIGSGWSMRARVRNHRHLLRNGRHPNRYLQHAYDRYGEDAFEIGVVQVLQGSTQAERLAIEEKWMTKLGTLAETGGGYNLSFPTNDTGRSMSNESRAKISAAMKGRPQTDAARESLRRAAQKRVGVPLSEETKAHMSAAQRGRTFSDEARARMSETRKGRPSPQKGKTMSDEARANMSAAARGKEPWNKGRSFSEETRAKMSAAAEGRKLSDVAREKVSASLIGNTRTKGKPWSEARRAAQNRKAAKLENGGQDAAV